MLDVAQCVMCTFNRVCHRHSLFETEVNHLTDFQEQQRSVIKIVRNRKLALVDTLLGTIGTFDDVAEYDHAISNMDQESFFKENFVPRLDEAIKRVIDGGV